MNELNDKIKELRTERHKIGTKTIDKINYIFKDLTQSEISIRGNLDVDYDFDLKEQYLNLNMDISFIKEDGTHYFKGGFNVYWKNDTLSINVGTSGTYDRTSIEQVNTAIMIADIWKNINTIEQQISGILNEVKDDYIRLQKEEYNLDRQIRETKQKESELKKQEILDSLTVGNKYSYEDKKLHAVYIIDKLTPQRVYYSKQNDSGNIYDSNVIMKREEFVKWIISGTLKPVTV